MYKSINQAEWILTKKHLYIFFDSTAETKWAKNQTLENCLLKTAASSHHFEL